MNRITAVNGKNEQKFLPEAKRTVLLALGIGALYGIGIVSAAVAAKITIDATHAGKAAMPYIPWAFAYVFIIGGMLSVVYGFFFRPRSLSITPERVALLKWDGEGKSLRKDELEGMEATPRRVILRGKGKTLRIGKTFAEWDKLQQALQDWAAR